jgi:hypothetical protein
MLKFEIEDKKLNKIYKYLFYFQKLVSKIKELRLNKMLHFSYNKKTAAILVDHSIKKLLICFANSKP